VPQRGGRVCAPSLTALRAGPNVADADHEHIRAWKRDHIGAGSERVGVVPHCFARRGLLPWL